MLSRRSRYLDEVIEGRLAAPAGPGSKGHAKNAIDDVELLEVLCLLRDESKDHIGSLEGSLSEHILVDVSSDTAGLLGGSQVARLVRIVESALVRARHTAGDTSHVVAANGLDRGACKLVKATSVLQVAALTSVREKR